MIKKFWSQFPKLKMSDRSHLIPLERNDRAIHDPEWLGALIFRSSYEKKASLARGYLSAVQIGAPINVARSINPLSKGNVYSGNCVLRHGCTQPLVHPSPPCGRGERQRVYTALKKRLHFFSLGQRMDLFIDLLFPREFLPLSLIFFFFLQVVCKLLAGLLRMWNVLTGTIIYIYIYTYLQPCAGYEVSHISYRSIVLGRKIKYERGGKVSRACGKRFLIINHVCLTRSSSKSRRGGC